MTRALILFLGGLFALGACTQRAICPAFQSAYIHDRDALRKQFSYFQEDSTPKILSASKNRYLVVEPTSYRRKIQSLQTIAMKPVPVIVPDSLLSGDSVSMEDLDRAARSVIDSTFIPDLPDNQELAAADDSIYVITKDRELRLLKYDAPDSLIYDPVSGKYVPEKPAYYVKDVRLNIDQDNYMWYLRQYLVLPDVKLARQQQETNRARDSAVKKKKQGLKGFFKNLFRKKPKEADSTEVIPPPRDEFDFIDIEPQAQAAPQPDPEPRKRGLFARKRRSDTAVEAVPADEAIKEEEVEPEERPATEQGF